MSNFRCLLCVFAMIVLLATVYDYMKQKLEQNQVEDIEEERNTPSHVFTVEIPGEMSEGAKTFQLNGRPNEDAHQNGVVALNMRPMQEDGVPREEEAREQRNDSVAIQTSDENRNNNNNNDVNCAGNHGESTKAKPVASTTQLSCSGTCMQIRFLPWIFM